MHYNIAILNKFFCFDYKENCHFNYFLTYLQIKEKNKIKHITFWLNSRFPILLFSDIFVNWLYVYISGTLSLFT